MNKKQKVSMKPKLLDFETANISRDELAGFLLNTAEKHKLVNRKVKDFASHPQFSVIYNKEELTGLLDITIAKVINTHEVWLMRKKGLPIEDCKPQISDELDLSTFGLIIGYLRSAYDNNVSKDYKRYIATKRKGDVISYDSANQEESDGNKQGNVIFNKIFEDTINSQDDKQEYHRLISSIFKFLRAYDKKVNKMLIKRTKNQLKEDKKSKLAYLFLYLLDPKYKGKFINIKEKLPEWSQYLFKKNKEDLANIIKNNFNNDLEFLFNYLNDSYDNYGETLRPKATSTYYNQSCEVIICYNYDFKGSNVSVSLNAQMVRKNNGKTEILESISQSVVVPKNNLETAKSELEFKMYSAISDLKIKSENLRIQSLKDIYQKAA